jgi:WD40 repeat protein
MPAETACPNTQELQLLLQGRLSDGEAEAMEGHVKHCAFCQQALGVVDQPDDDLVETARTLGEQPVIRKPEVIDGLIQQLVSLSVDTQANTASAGTAGEAVDFGALLERPQAADELGRLGRYRVLQLLGAGGMGVVFRAQDTQLGRLVALKVIKPRLAEKASARERFLREARSAARLRHPAIVPLYEVGSEGGLANLAYALIEGPTLAAWLSKNKPTARQAAEWSARLAEALECAHASGIVHRDVKPGNVMLDQSGLPMLADFGVALETDALGDVTQEGDIVGTPAYMAPEQAAGRRGQVGPLSDVYSLGALLYELLCGRPPFQGNVITILHLVVTEDPTPLRDIRPGVPRDLETICRKAMAKEPYRRYVSAGAMAEDLRRYLEHLPIRARRPGPLGRLALGCRRRPVAALSIAVAMAVCIVSGFASFWQVVRERDQARLQAATYALERGIGLCESGDPAQGIVWMVRSLKLAPAEAQHLTWAIRANLAAWQTEVPRREKVLEATDPRADPAKRWDASYPFCDFGASGDGTVAALASQTGLLQVWDLVRHACICEIDCGGGCPLFSLGSSGHTLITADANRLRLWRIDPAGAKLINEWHADAGRPLILSPDERSAAFAGRHHQAWIWDIQTGEPKGEPLQHPADVTSLAFSASSGQLATGCADGTVRIWDTETHRLLGRVLEQGSAVASVALHPYKDIVGTVGDDNKARLWNWTTAQLLHRPFETYGTGVARFSPDGAILACSSADRFLRFWDVTAEKPACPPLRYPFAIAGVAFTGPRTILTGTEKGVIERGQVATSKEPVLTLLHEAKVRSAAFSPDGAEILTGCGRGVFSTLGYAQFWNARTGQSLASRIPSLGSVLALSIAADGNTFLIGDGRGVARLWRRTDGRWEERAHLEWPTMDRGRPGVSTAALSPNGSLAVAGAFAEAFPYAMVFDTTTGKRLEPALVHGRPVRSAVFSPDGTRIVTGAYDRTVRVWDAQTYQQIGESMENEGDVGAVAISPDGKLVLAGNDAKQAQLWDAQTCKPVGSPLRHLATVRSVSFSPDGRLIATGSWDKTARLWEPVTSLPVGPPFRHEGEVEVAVFSPDGRQLLTAGWDKTARLWDIPEPMPGSLAEITSWAEALTGMKLDASDTIHLFHEPAGAERQRN